MPLLLHIYTHLQLFSSSIHTSVKSPRRRKAIASILCWIQICGFSGIELMTTKANGGLNSSEEREGQQMVPAHGRNQMHGPDRRNLQLIFQSMFPDSFFTERNVEGQGGAPIHVQLIDTSTGHAVRSGPESCVKLKVVVVEGDFNNEDDDDWTQEDFERGVVKQRKAKRPLLIGKLHVHLKEGVGSLGKLRFGDNSSWTRSRNFRLGVKVASGLREGVRVLEAITNPFVVKDCRGEVYKKHDLPASDDEVWRLKKIKKNGPFHKGLNDNGIFTVEDFLWLLGTDPKGLRKILGSSMREKMWDALVEHAKTCDLRGKHYVYYADNTKNFGVVFKSICELSGYIAGGKYYSAETLSDSQKVSADSLKREACAKWRDIVEYHESLMLMDMNPNKRARSSPTDFVNEAPDQHVPPPDQVLEDSGLVVGDPPVPFDQQAPVPDQPPSVTYFEENDAVLFSTILEDSGLVVGDPPIPFDQQAPVPDQPPSVTYFEDPIFPCLSYSMPFSDLSGQKISSFCSAYHPHMPCFESPLSVSQGGVGYDENFGNRYPIHSHRSSAQMHLESSTVGWQMQLMSSSHQSQMTRNDHMRQPESASCFGFQSIGSSGLPSNLISYDDPAGYNNNRGADEFFSEEEIRMRSHEMLENDDMQQLLRLFSTGAAPANASNDGYPYSSYIQPPSTNFNFKKSPKAAVGFLKLKAALRWGVFIRKKAAERRAQLVELED